MKKKFHFEDRKTITSFDVETVSSDLKKNTSIYLSEKNLKKNRTVITKSKTATGLFFHEETSVVNAFHHPYVQWFST